MQNIVWRKDLVIILTPVLTLILAFLDLSSPVWVFIRLAFAIPSLLFIPGYSILTNIFRINKFSYEEGAYSLAISIAIVVLTGYVVDVLRTPLPHQLLTINACVITLISYFYGFILNKFRGKFVGK